MENASPGRLALNCITVKGLIARAYDYHADGPMRLKRIKPIEGGPDWINTEQFNISARAADGNPTDVMNGPMMQALLEDRFKLKIRSETRDVPGYALTVAKGGPKLPQLVEGTCVPFAPASAPPAGQHFCDHFWLSGEPSVTINFIGASLKTFTDDLSLRVARPIVDKTGLTGLYDFHLEFAPDESTPTLHHALVPADTTVLSIFTALQEPLKLKLEGTRLPGEFLVIDSIERPSEN